METFEIDGIRLNVAVEGEGPSVLLLHGFTGSASTWAAFVQPWSGFRIIAVDIVGHGRSDSPPDPDRYRMDRCVHDLAAVLDGLGVRKTAVLGYSMGGRVALHLALLAPERLRAIVLESASPGIDDPCERSARVRSDGELAEEIERDGVEAFVARWEALPLFASQRRLPATAREDLRRQRLQNDPSGLANSLRGMGAGAQGPLLARLGEIRAPTLLLAGSLDERYCAITQRVAARISDARTEIVPDAGHAVHLEQPEIFSRLVREFLEAHARLMSETEE